MLACSFGVIDNFPSVLFQKLWPLWFDDVFHWPFHTLSSSSILLTPDPRVRFSLGTIQLCIVPLWTTFKCKEFQDFIFTEFPDSSQSLKIKLVTLYDNQLVFHHTLFLFQKITALALIAHFCMSNLLNHACEKLMITGKGRLKNSVRPTKTIYLLTNSAKKQSTKKWDIRVCHDVLRKPILKFWWLRENRIGLSTEDQGA